MSAADPSPAVVSAADVTAAMVSATDLSAAMSGDGTVVAGTDLPEDRVLGARVPATA